MVTSIFEITLFSDRDGIIVALIIIDDPVGLRDITCKDGFDTIAQVFKVFYLNLMAGVLKD